MVKDSGNYPGFGILISVLFLPGKCQSCNKLFPVAELQKVLRGDTSSSVSIICNGCCSTCTFSPQYMKGDPRNQAIIIHEDGWASHSTSSAHSVAAITISNACSTKFDRSSGNSCRVYSFIPVDKLPVKAPHKFDAFLTPLIDEVEFLFLQGKRVFF